MAAVKFMDGYFGWKHVRAFSLQVLLGRWFIIFAALQILSASGATYIFGLYSNDIKTSLGYDQTTLNTLSFFKDLGGNVGVISGLINEITPPWFVLLVGAIMNFFGYFMIWLAVTSRVSKPKIWQMCLYICCGANSQTFANTGAIVPCVRNFPESRGSVLGILKGFVGLSGAIFTQFYRAFYGDNSKELILLIAWLPAAVSIFLLRIVRVVKVVRSRESNELKTFFNFLYVSLGLAGFLMILIIIQNWVRFTRLEYVGSACVVIILLLVPLAFVLKEEFSIWKSKLQALNDTTSKNHLKVVTENPPDPVELSSQEPPSPPHATGAPENSQTDTKCVENVFKPPKRGEDYTILQALFSIDMLILFVTTICSAGGTLTAIDNLGQIGDSLGYPRHSLSTFVSLISIWNYLGRVTSGFGSDFLWTKYKLPRPLLLTSILLFSCIGFLLIAFGVPNSLYFSSVILGFCFGAQWPLIFAITSEIFGLKYYATLYNLGGAASPVGAYILNVRVTGYLYDKEAMKQMKDLGLTREKGQDLTCNGVQCYKLAFIIIAAVALFGSVTSIILVLRTRKFYKGDIYKRFRQEVGEGGEMGTR